MFLPRVVGRGRYPWRTWGPFPQPYLTNLQTFTPPTPQHTVPPRGWCDGYGYAAFPIYYLPACCAPRCQCDAAVPLPHATLRYLRCRRAVRTRVVQTRAFPVSFHTFVVDAVLLGGICVWSAPWDLTAALCSNSYCAADGRCRTFTPPPPLCHAARLSISFSYSLRAGTPRSGLLTLRLFFCRSKGIPAATTAPTASRFTYVARGWDGLILPASLAPTNLRAHAHTPPPAKHGFVLGRDYCGRTYFGLCHRSIGTVPCQPITL